MKHNECIFAQHFSIIGHKDQKILQVNDDQICHEEALLLFTQF
jgi:hypothetical protein